MTGTGRGGRGRGRGRGRGNRTGKQKERGNPFQDVEKWGGGIRMESGG
jgi:hypothetical protein